MADTKEKQQKRMEASLREKEAEARARAEERSIDSAGRPQDESSPRAKSSGHRKVTADKWNQ
jgi:hypothetical protein